MFEFLIHVLIMASLYGLLSLSLNVQVGLAGMVNFGHIVLFGCGAYGAAIAHFQGWHPAVGFVLGLAAAALVALAFARLGRNLGADYWGIATLSIAEALRIAISNEQWLAGGAQGVHGLPQLFGFLTQPWGQLSMLSLCAGVLALSWLFCRQLTASRFGLALKLMREEPNLAQSLGYDLMALRRTALLAAATIAAISGWLSAGYITFVGPDQLVSSETFLIWAMLIVGGLGNNLGAIVGAVLMQMLLAYVPFVKDAMGLPSEFVAAMRLTLVGGGLLAFLLWRTQGLIPERIGGRHA